MPQITAPLMAAEAMNAERAEKVRMARSSSGCSLHDAKRGSQQTTRKGKAWTPSEHALIVTIL